MSKDIAIEDCLGKIVTYKSNITGNESWNGMIKKIEPDDEGEIEINGCHHLFESINISEILKFDY